MIDSINADKDALKDELDAAEKKIKDLESDKAGDTTTTPGSSSGMLVVGLEGLSTQQEIKRLAGICIKGIRDGKLKIKCDECGLYALAHNKRKNGKQTSMCRNTDCNMCTADGDFSYSSIFASAGEVPMSVASAANDS